MENVILTVHLILALLLIGVVLLQRSEGGGLGMGGGGGGGGGVMTGRQAANALTKLTWFFAIGFLVTSVSLTVIAARKADSGSVVDGLTQPVPTEAITPPPADAPATPPAADAPVSPPPAN